MTAIETVVKTFQGLTQSGLSFENLNANVTLNKSDESNVKVLLKGTEKQHSRVTVEEDRTQIVIKFKEGSSSSGIYINGGSVVISGGIVSVNGVTYVGGQREESPMEIIAYIPEGWDLDVQACGVASLVSNLPLNSVNLTISGRASFILNGTKDLDIKCSGQSKGVVREMEGSLRVTCSGQSSIQTQGIYNSIDLSSSGQSVIKTTGVCKGNYRATASGMSNLEHVGTINGRVTKNASGMSSISV